MCLVCGPFFGNFKKPIGLRNRILAGIRGVNIFSLGSYAFPVSIKTFILFVVSSLWKVEKERWREVEGIDW